MADDNSENVSTVPDGCEFRSDCLSYFNKNQWLPSSLLYVLLGFALVGIGALIYGFITGQYAEMKEKYGDSDISLILLFFSFPTAMGVFFDILIILFVNYEEFYRLNKEGFYSEEKKLYGRVTRKTVPLNSIERFVLDSRVQIDKHDERTVYFFVNIITRDATIKILEFDESEKHIPEWFVSSGNAVLANLTGRVIETPIASSDAPVSTPSAGYAGMTDNPSAFGLQDSYPLDNSSNNNLYINQPVQPNNEYNNLGVNSPQYNAYQYNDHPTPPNCELGADYLSYLEKPLGTLVTLFGILFVFALLASICTFSGIISFGGINTVIQVVVLLIVCSIVFFSLYFSKEIGRLDKNGFHLESYSIMGRSTQDIPLDSILGFRLGMRESQSRDGTSIVYFVEIVTSGKHIRVLEGGDEDNNRREWLVYYGNALLANFKGNAAAAQRYKEEKHSGDSMDVSDFNDDVE